MFICDGHVSNLSDQFLDLANKNNIDILAFPSHTSTLLQPLDSVPFRELKKFWKLTVHEFVQQHSTLDKEDFLHLIRGPLHQAHNPLYIEKAWKKTGLWPLNPSKAVLQPPLSQEQIQERIKSLYTIPIVASPKKKSIKKYLTTKGKVITAPGIRDYLRQERERIEKEALEKAQRKGEKKALKEQKEKEKEENKKKREEKKTNQIETKKMKEEEKQRKKEEKDRVKTKQQTKKTSKRKRS